MKKIISTIVLFVIFSANVALFSNDLFKEAKYVPADRDLFLYLNNNSIQRFFKKNNINFTELLNITGENFSAGDVFIINKIFKEIDDLLIIGNVHEIEKQKGAIILIKAKKRLKEFDTILFSLPTDIIENKKVIILDKKKGLYLTISDNVYIVGFKDLITKYIIAKNEKKVFNSTGLKTVIYNSKGKTLYYFVKVSKYFKDQMDAALKMTSQMASNLQLNPFIKSMLKVHSAGGGVILGDEISIYTVSLAHDKKDINNILMFNHFAIVGSSFAVSFANLFFSYMNKKSYKRRNPNSKKMNSMIIRFYDLIARIKTIETSKGVVVSFKLNKSETKEIVVHVKNLIEKKKKEIAKRKRRAKIRKLFSAIKRGKLKNVKFLINEVKDLNVKNYNGESPLYVAVKYNQIEIVKYFILKGAAADFKDYNGNNILQIAVKGKNLKIVKLLLTNGSNSKNINKRGENILHTAVSAGILDLVKLFMNKRASVNFQTKSGFSPLHFNAMQGNIDVFNLLIQNNANINLKANDGSTPLHKAAYFGHFEIVKALVKAGADKNIKDINGATAKDKAEFQGLKQIVDFLNQQ